jgi:anti-sigma factor RsiW
MIGRRNSQNPSDRDLVALADGSISGSRRARLERLVAGSPELRADLEGQRRALRAISDAGRESAPGRLRATLELARDPRPASRFSQRLLATAGSGVVAVAALAIAAVLVLGGGPSGGPTVAAAAILGTREPVQMTAATDPGVIAAGIQFPDWQAEFGFRAAGVRRDRIDGRLATTVFYAHGADRVAYTIVDGRALPVGASTTDTVWDGLKLRSFASNGQTVVTWLRAGHTCILTGSPALLEAMETLASWRVGTGESAALSAPSYS